MRRPGRRMWEAWADSNSHGLVHEGYARRPERFGRHIDLDFFFDLAGLASVASVEQKNFDPRNSVGGIWPLVSYPSVSFGKPSDSQ